MITPDDGVKNAADPRLPSEALDDDMYDYPVEKKMLRGTMSGCVPEFPCAKRAVGKMYVIKEKRNSDDGSLKFICVAGPCWPMVLVTFCLIVGVSAGLLYHLSGLVSSGWIIAGAILGFISAMAFLFTACSDPGILPRHNVQPSADWVWNEPGRTFRPPGALFDQEAQCVIKKVDHFCPWTGTVIGGGNMRCFQIFTSTLCITILFILVLFIGNAVGSDGF